jgi:hypothetical protein
MALYSTCLYPIHNALLSHGCYAILIVYHTMPCSSISYALYVVRPDVLCKAIGLFCLCACLSALLVRPKGGRPRGARVVSVFYRHTHRGIPPRCRQDRKHEGARNTKIRQVRATESIIPYVFCGLYCLRWWMGDLLFGGGPCPSLYSLRGQGYMEVPVGYEPRSHIRVIFR